MLKSSLLGLMLSMLTIGMTSIAKPAQAVTKNWTGCPVSSTYGVDPGPRFSVSWVVSGENRVIAFQGDHIKLGAGKGNMTLAQLDRWKYILEQLRTAAAKKIKVTVYYDDETRHVKAVIARWNQNC